MRGAYTTSRCAALIVLPPGEERSYAGAVSNRVLAFALTLVAACAAPPAPAPAPPAPSASPPAAPSAIAAASASASASAAPELPPPEGPLPAAIASPLPEGFTPIAEKGETKCGKLRVEMLTEKPPSQFTFVRVKDAAGKVVYEAHGRQDRSGTEVWPYNLTADYCGDLTGDGIPELVMTESSMGAHCCYTYYVISLGPTPERILMWQKGDAGTAFVPVKYRPGKAYQLQGWYVFWPPFNPEAGDPALNYASAPVIPAVLSLVGGKYALTSLGFPEAYRKDREEHQARCAAEKDCPKELFELFDWVDAVAIGDWEQEKHKVTDPENRKILDARAAATRKKLEKELGSLRVPVEPR